MYMVVYDWAYNGEEGIRVIERDTLEEARKELDKITTLERTLAQDVGYEIFVDNEIYFEAGNPNNYREEHIKIAIKKMRR